MNDAILSLLITSVGAILALVVRYSYYSKCDNIKCCWCCEIHRQITNEENEIQEVKVTTPNKKGLPEQKSFTMV
jgi:hypothetical protein